MSSDEEPLATLSEAISWLLITGVMAVLVIAAIVGACWIVLWEYL